MFKRIFQQCLLGLVVVTGALYAEDVSVEQTVFFVNENASDADGAIALSFQQDIFSTELVTVRVSVSDSVTMTLGVDYDLELDNGDGFVYSFATPNGVQVIDNLNGTFDLAFDNTPNGTIDNTSINLNFVPLDDLIVEAAEQVVITVVSSAGVTPVDNADTATITLVDNEPGVFFTTVNDLEEEGLVNGELTLNLTADAETGGGNTEVQLIFEGNAIDATDYTAAYTGSPGNIQILPGTRTATITLTPIQDTIVEGYETVVVKTAHDQGIKATVRIVDREPALTIAQSTPAIEGTQDGELVLNFATATATSVTIPWAISGTAERDVDYSTGDLGAGTTGTLVIGAGETSYTVTVNAPLDAISEGNETLILTANGTIQGQLIIIDGDDPATGENEVIIEALGGRVTEDSGEFIEIAVRRISNSPLGTITVPFEVDGAADELVDFVLRDEDDNNLLTAQVSFASGESTKIIRVYPLADAISEGGEDVRITIKTGPNYKRGDQVSATVMIRDDESTASIVENPDRAMEAQSVGDQSLWGGFRVNFTDTGSSKRMKVRMTGTAEMVALGGSDYEFFYQTEGGQIVLMSATFIDATNGTWEINVPAGSASVEFYVVPYQISEGLDESEGAMTFSSWTEVFDTFSWLYDTDPEGGETVIVSVLESDDFIRESSTSTVTIWDDDIFMVPVVINDASEPAYSGRTRVTLSQSVNRDLTVPYQVITSSGFAATPGDGSVSSIPTGGIASDVHDYKTLPGFITVPAGETTAEILIEPFQDDLDELIETVTLRFQSSANFQMEGEVTLVVNIADPIATVTGISNGSVTSVSEAEGSTVVGTFDVTVDRGTGANFKGDAFEINFSLDGSTATLDQDYTGDDIDLSQGKLFIPSTTEGATVGGIQTVSFSFEVIDDQIVEIGGETVTVTLQSGAGYALDVSGPSSITIADDEPVISLTTISDMNETSGHAARVQVSYSGSLLQRDITVLLSIDAANSTAVEGTDFNSIPTEITIPGGTSGGGSPVATFTIVPKTDTETEGIETVTVLVGESSLYGIESTASSALVQILEGEGGNTEIVSEPETIVVTEGTTVTNAVRVKGLVNPLPANFEASIASTEDESGRSFDWSTGGSLSIETTPSTITSSISDFVLTVNPPLGTSAGHYRFRIVVKVDVDQDGELDDETLLQDIVVYVQTAGPDRPAVSQ